MTVYNQKRQKIKVANMCNFFTKLDVSCFHYYFSNRSHFHNFLCIFMHHIWKKSLFPYLQFATNRMSIFKKMRPWELVEKGSLNRNTRYIYKRFFPTPSTIQRDIIFENPLTGLQVMYWIAQRSNKRQNPWNESYFFFKYVYICMFTSYKSRVRYGSLILVWGWIILWHEY